MILIVKNGLKLLFQAIFYITKNYSFVIKLIANNTYNQNPSI